MKRLAFAAIAAVLAASPALAAHGKVGLWQITIRMNMAGMIPPAQLAKMRAMGLHMPTDSASTHRHCMTAAEVAMNRPPPSSHGMDCKVQNVRITGQSFSSDTVCSGRMQGTGHATMTFSSPEHYSGRVNFTGTAHGRPANMTMSVDGKWLSPSCGKVAN